MPELLTPLRESRAKKVNEDLPQAILTNPGIRRDAASVSIALASFTPENGHKARRRSSLAVLYAGAASSGIAVVDRFGGGSRKVVAGFGGVRHTPFNIMPGIAGSGSYAGPRGRSDRLSTAPRGMPPPSPIAQTPQSVKRRPGRLLPLKPCGGRPSASSLVLSMRNNCWDNPRRKPCLPESLTHCALGAVKADM